MATFYQYILYFKVYLSPLKKPNLINISVFKKQNNEKQFRIVYNIMNKIINNYFIEKVFEKFQLSELNYNKVLPV